jgi:hypothetical protein
MDQSRWLNPSQPQPLQNANILLYVQAAFTLLFAGLGGAAALLVAGDVAAGYGIANDKRWGYQVGLVMAFLPFAVTVVLGGPLDLIPRSTAAFVDTAFAVLLVVLLVHPESRAYQRIWFE